MFWNVEVSIQTHGIHYMTDLRAYGIRNLEENCQLTHVLHRRHRVPYGLTLYTNIDKRSERVRGQKLV